MISKIKNFSYTSSLNNANDIILKSLNAQRDYLITKLPSSKNEFSINFTSTASFNEISTNVIGKTFTYANFSVPLHYETKVEIPQIFGTGSSPDSFYKVTFDMQYNFLIKKYEEFASKNNALEVGLPQFYKILDKEVEATFYGRQLIFDSISLFENTQNLQTRQTQDIESNKVIRFNASPFNLSLEKYLTTYNSFKEQFPMYTEIKFNNFPLPKKEQYFSKFYKELENGYFYFLQADSGSLQRFTDTSNGSSSLFYSRDIDTLLKREVFPNRPSDFSDEQKINFFKNLSKLSSIIDFKAEEFEKNYEDILINGEKNYSEIVAYKISKFDTFGNNPTPIQVFYVPITGESTTEIIDTCIKYDKKYRYQISSVILVIANKYTYRNLRQNAATSRFTVEVETTPTVLKIEIPSTSFEGFLLDSPPIEPDVELIPYIGVPDKIKININTGIGKKIDTPIVFSDNEKKSIERLKQAQFRQDNKIFYQSDEPSEYFEMYVLKNAPKDFFDFLKGDKYIISSRGSSAGSIELTMNQNTIYYLTFRSFDYHGNFSSPTGIYTAELINDNGNIYPIFGNYDANNLDKECLSRNFSRFLSIEPSLSSLVFDPELNDLSGVNSKSGLVSLSKIGTTSPSIWGKKLKFRVTSRSSGRKIDLNIVFNINKEQ